MSLHDGVDIIGFVSTGVYSDTYGSTSQRNINLLFVSLGLLEDIPTPSTKRGNLNSVVTADS